MFFNFDYEKLKLGNFYKILLASIRMTWKSALSLIFFVIVIALLVFYWIIPFGKIDFGTGEPNYNFSINDSGQDSDGYVSQFYPNMRFPEKEISYSINDCPVSKENDMETAFGIVSNLTILKFYPSGNNPQIIVTCDSKTRIEGGLFIAGEGGPENVIRTSNFNVISSGKILLLRDSACPQPNVGIHELLHVLGFNHSSNPENIMYPYSSCDQDIGKDIINTINLLYSFPSYPDLSVENASAVMNGKYIDANITLENSGLADSKDSALKIYADGEVVKEISVSSLKIGYGREISLKNIFVLQLDVREIRFEIDYPYDELEKVNNAVALKVTNN